MEFLLQSLRCGHTRVRWSAAKGIGRLTMRLPKGWSASPLDRLLYGQTPETAFSRHPSDWWCSAALLGLCGCVALGQDVVDEVMTLFSVREGEESWHGGCLALGELVRRGESRPHSFSLYTPWMAESGGIALPCLCCLQVCCSRRVWIRQWKSSCGL